MHILYIDDEADNRLLVKRMVLMEGWQMSEAGNARDGIRMAMSTVPDLILMDISMPDIDGLTATKILKAVPALAHVNIVALTANAMQGDRERFLAEGCDGYISKPINIDTFIDTLLSFLPQTQPAQTQPAQQQSAQQPAQQQPAQQQPAQQQPAQQQPAETRPSMPAAPPGSNVRPTGGNSNNSVNSQSGRSANEAGSGITGASRQNFRSG